MRLRLLTDQDLTLRISGWRFESARSHAISRWPVTAASSSPGGEVGLIRRTCRVRSPGLLRTFEVWLNLVRARGSGPRDWWFESTHLDDTASRSPGGDGSLTNCRRRVRFPGSLRTRSVSTVAVQSPDKRQRKVRVLHGARYLFSLGMRSVVVSTRDCGSRRNGFNSLRIPLEHVICTCCLVPKSSGEDARLSTVIGEFDPRRDRDWEGMYQGGELHLQCGCGRFDSGPFHDR